MTKKGLHRLFFALELSEEFKYALHQCLLSLGINGKLVEPENFHATLLFLGAIKNHQVFDIIDNIEIPEQPDFTLSLGKYGFFIKTEILYCAIAQGHSSMTALHHFLKQKTQDLEFIKRDKRHFVPHITLAREVKPPSDFAESIRLEQPVEGFCLMESIQTKSGVIYETIEEWQLNSPSVKQQLLGRP